MNAGNKCSASFSSGSHDFDQYRKRDLSDKVFKTTSGAAFRCEYADMQKIERLFCGQCSGHKKHIMEAKPLGRREVCGHYKAILDMRPKNASMIEPMKGCTLAADINCIKNADPINFEKYEEDKELTGLSRRLFVSCARRVSIGLSRQLECGMRVKLSDLPEHFHGTNWHPCPPLVVESQRQHAASEGLGAPGNFSEMSVVSEDERGLVDAFSSQLSSSNKKTESLEEIIDAQAGKISQLQNTVDNLSNTVDTLSLTCAEYEILIKELQERRTDGTIVWKIDNFMKTVMAAKRGGDTSIYSLPFYSAPDGYKMSVKIYPNGSGEGKGTHISLFLAIMKGEHDDILTWPFNQKFTFEIIGKGGKVLWADEFEPDPASSSFQKPQRDMNKPTGCPQSMELRDLKSTELSDGSLFVRVKVGDKANDR